MFFLDPTSLACYLCVARRADSILKMTIFKSTPKENRIIGLFPELLGLGGIQEAGRLTAAAVDAIAIRNESFRSFLSLNDPPGLQTFRVGERSIAFRGFGRAKMRFVLSAVGQPQVFGSTGRGDRSCAPSSSGSSGFVDERTSPASQDNCDVTRCGSLETR